MAPTRRNRQVVRSIGEEPIDLITASTHLFGLITPIVVMVNPHSLRFDKGSIPLPAKKRGATASWARTGIGKTMQIELRMS